MIRLISWSGYRWLRCAVPLVLLVALAGCSGSIFPSRTCDDKASIENLAYLTLPPSAANIRVECAGFTDFFIYLSFAMAPDDLDALRESLRAPLADDVIPDELLRSERLRGWGLNPDQITAFLAGEYTNFPYQYVLIDMTDPVRYVVWVFTYTT